MYELGNYEFKLEEFFPRKAFDEITRIRVDDRSIIEAEARRRKRRAKLTKDGKLCILAADHPARRVTKSGEDPIAMGNRQEYLGRILRVLINPEFDGIMGTPDIIEDLLIIDHLVKQRGGKSFLDDKVILGCMNRGGLAGCSFEMDDTFTAFTAERIHKMRFDGAKLMFRLEPNEEASGKTVLYCANAINALNKYDLPAFLECLPVEKVEKSYKVKKNAADFVQVVGVATGLADSSKNTWLKIQYCDNFELVSKSTTCPILLLGGESRGDPTGVMNDFISGMKAGSNVRGVLVGRNVTFPGKDDPYAAAGAISKIVHAGYPADKAVSHLMESRGKNMDFLSRYF
ncbi:MAG: hypothetical protein PHH26_04795 [Candidatus Thermoplasmatota archaeon]|nr:hypothetical protein [Candidatus Thermoplasmatota archaeon]